jgi:hypothetical protein
VTSIDIVRSALPVFHAHPDAADGELVEFLKAAGVPAAERVVAFLPIAYGRRLLDGLVELPATFLVGGREHRLTDDPIYAAADHLACTEATKADVGAIGMRSAEVSVVNQALNAGSNPADLLLSPPILMVDNPGPTTEQTGDAARRSSGGGHLRALMRRLGGGAKSRHP